MKKRLLLLLLPTLLCSCGPGGVAAVLLALSGGGDSGGGGGAAFRVVWTHPAGNAESVPADTVILVGFSEPVDSRDVDQGHFLLTGPGGGVARSVALVDLCTVAVAPAAAMAEGSHTLTVLQTVRSATGAQLSSDYLVQFDVTTAACAPRLVYTTPADGTSVPHHSTVTVYLAFSTAMDLTSLQSGVAMSNSGGGVAVNVTGSGTIFTVAATTPQSPDSYTLTIASDVRAQNGLTLGHQERIDFQTVALEPTYVRIPPRADCPENTINLQTQSGVEVEVGLPAEAAKGDFIHVVLDDGVSSPVWCVRPLTPGAYQRLGPLDTGALQDGGLTLSATIVRSGWESSQTVAAVLKDTAPPTLVVSNPAGFDIAAVSRWIHPLGDIMLAATPDEDVAVEVGLDGNGVYTGQLTSGVEAQIWLSQLKAAKTQTVEVKVTDGAGNERDYSFELLRVGGVGGALSAGGGRLDVYVHDACTLSPISGATVTAGSGDESPTSTSQTDSEGHARLNGVKPDHLVSFFADGYCPITIAPVTGNRVSVLLMPSAGVQTADLTVNIPSGSEPVVGRGACSQSIVTFDANPNDGTCRFGITPGRQYSAAVWGSYLAAPNFRASVATARKPLGEGGSFTLDLPAPDASSTLHTIGSSGQLTLPADVLLPQYQQPVWRGSVTMRLRFPNETGLLSVSSTSFNDSFYTGTGNYAAADMDYFEAAQATHYVLQVRCMDIHGRLYTARKIGQSPIEGDVDLSCVAAPEIYSPATAEVVYDSAPAFSWSDTTPSGFYEAKVSDPQSGLKWFFVTRSPSVTVPLGHVPDGFADNPFVDGTDLDLTVTAYDVTPGAEFGFSDARLDAIAVSTSRPRRFHYFDATVGNLTKVGFSGPPLTSPGTLTVRVYDLGSGQPVSGAAVYTGEFPGLGLQYTDASGVALLQDVTTPVKVTVAAAGYQYFTVDGLNASHLTLLLEPDGERLGDDYVLYGETEVAVPNWGFVAIAKTQGTYFVISDSSGSDDAGHSAYDPSGPGPVTENFSFRVRDAIRHYYVSILDPRLVLVAGSSMRAAAVVEVNADPQPSVGVLRCHDMGSVTLDSNIYTPMDNSAPPSTMQPPTSSDLVVDPDKYAAIAGAVDSELFINGMQVLGLGRVDSAAATPAFGLSHIWPSTTHDFFFLIARAGGTFGDAAKGETWRSERRLTGLSAFPPACSVSLPEVPRISYPQNTSTVAWNRRVQFTYTDIDSTAYFILRLEPQSGGSWAWQILVLPDGSGAQSVRYPTLPAGLPGPQSGDALSIQLSQGLLAGFNSDSVAFDLMMMRETGFMEVVNLFTWSP